MSNMVFPPNPAIGEEYTASNGITYTWDGEAWTAQSGIHAFWTDNQAANSLTTAQAGRSVMLGPGSALTFNDTSTNMSLDSESPTYLCMHSPDTIELETAGSMKLLATATDVEVSVPLMLASDPTLALQAATKQYVDAVIGGGPTVLHYKWYAAAITAPDQIGPGQVGQLQGEVGPYLFIHSTDADGVDQTAPLSGLTGSQVVTVRDSTDTLLFQFTLTGSADATYYPALSLPGSINTGGILPTDGQDIYITLPPPLPIWSMSAGTIVPTETNANPESQGQALALWNPKQPWNGQYIYFGDPLDTTTPSHLWMASRAFSLELSDGSTQFYVSNYTGGTAAELDIPGNSTFDVRIGSALAARIYDTALALGGGVILSDYALGAQPGAIRYSAGRFQGYNATGAWVNFDEPLSSNAPPTVIGTVPPVTPVVGQLWWRNTDGALFIYYDDGTSRQWVPVVPGK